MLLWFVAALMEFLSTPSARRATAAAMVQDVEDEFLSTPSARRATAFQHLHLGVLGDFYPRPPRGGRLAQMNLLFEPKGISIHALREEGDIAALVP